MNDRSHSDKQWKDIYIKLDFNGSNHDPESYKNTLSPV